MAFAAPVDVGIIDNAAARARRRSLCGKSRITWSFVYEWIVVIDPVMILNLSLMTLATGARQFVVQDAFEMMWCLAESYLSSFTPSTMVMSSPVAGAEMMTFFTVPCRCALAASALVNLPVDSMTTCAPNE